MYVLRTNKVWYPTNVATMSAQVSRLPLQTNPATSDILLKDVESSIWGRVPTR